MKSLKNMPKLPQFTRSLSSPKDQTHFGFKSVKITDKQQMVKQVFDRVADRYDFMNDVMSLGGLHRVWKRYLIQSVLRPGIDTKLVDVAGGTGDLAREFIRECRKLDNHSSDGNNYSCNVVDINQSMLDQGKKRWIQDQANLAADLNQGTPLISRGLLMIRLNFNAFNFI